ncbi:hypothetical protein DVH24_033551 [Malus domestica]|uniref:Uncharacterized protein n=1 Tax=Malus domestica TaxID=3750 RepID=A0A498JCT8_MALDO|nr:hypothetical protein DVH24_033551 [Malus domestica]
MFSASLLKKPRLSITTKQSLGKL